MAEGSEVGTAYVTLVVSGQGIVSGIQSQMAGVAVASGAAGASAGGMFAGGMMGAIKKALPVAAVAGAVVGLFKIGEAFEQMDIIIAKSTGATGEALNGLSDSAKKVATQTGASFEKVGTVVGDLNTRLGITGQPLEALSLKMLKFAKITDSDVGEATRFVTRMFGDWSVKTEDQNLAMDKLAYVSQHTGITVTTLADNMAQFGSPLRQMGFTMEETAAMFGRFEREGVNTGTVLAGLKMGLKGFAKAGEEPAEAFRRAIEAIKGASSAAEANSLAFKIFGVRAGPDMAAAIREGRFELDTLVDGMNNAGGTVDKTAAQIRTAGDAFRNMKNQLLVALAPVGEGIREIFDKAAMFISDVVAPIISKFIGFISTKVAPVLEKIGEVVAGVFKGFQAGGIEGGFKAIGAAFTKWIPVILEKLGDLAKAFLAWILPLIPPMLQKLGDLLLTVGRWIITTALPAIVSKLVELAKAFAAWIGPALPGILVELGRLIYRIAAWIITDALPAIAVQLVKLGWGLLQALGTALAPLGQFILEQLAKLAPYITAGLAQLGEWIASPFVNAWNAIVGALEWLGGQISGWFSALPGKIVGALGYLGDLLYGAGADVLTGMWNGLKALWQTVSGWFGQRAENIKNNFTSAGQWLYDAGSRIITGIWNGLKAIWEAVSGWFAQRGSNIKANFTAAATWLWDTGKSIIQGMWDGVKAIWESLAGWVGNIGGWIKQKIGNLGSLLWEAGADVFRGFWNGLKSIWNHVTGWIQDQINKIPSWVRKILGIGSPSRVMADIGKNVMQGLQIGMAKSAGAAVVTAARTAQRVTDAMQISGTYAAGPTGLAAGTGAQVIHIGSITIDGSKMASADFAGLIESIQTAVRMGG